MLYPAELRAPCQNTLFYPSSSVGQDRVEALAFELFAAVQRRQLDQDGHATTTPPSSLTRRTAALAVPPVASRSSTTSTRCPGVTASRCISRLSVP